MILHTIVISDDDLNMQPFIGVTKEEALISILRVHGPEIYAIEGKTEKQFKARPPHHQAMCVESYFQGNGVRFWLQSFGVEAPHRVIYDVNHVSIWQQIEFVKAMVADNYQELDHNNRFDWDKWEENATEEQWVQLYEAHQECEDYAADFGGRNTWGAVAEERIWEGLIPLKEVVE